ncbi:hypothetical protein DL95DRAFT_455981 [Leptodontidium sp. 2 PMI_412]|nr:hypothetical protein DL95DRAFT_455981 [Leptodontidium sp. 2 PMI_412]
MAYLYFGGLVTCSMSILAAGVRRKSEKHPVSLWRGTIMSITAIAMGIYHLWITRHVILAGNVAVLVWSITGVEPMLCKNSITNVNSLAATGQLIPFIIGVATVAKLAFNAMTEDYEPPLLIWSFFFYEEQKVLNELEGQSINLLQRVWNNR